MKPLKDSQFKELQYTLSAREHRYGEQVHILSDPFLHTQLAKLCSIETTQPWINELIISLYSALMKTVINQEFPQKQVITHSRMSTSHMEGIFESPIIDPSTKVVSVNLARAGTLPSHTCYHLLNYLMDPKQVRQDHISIARQTDQAHHVTGSAVSGHKIGGPVDDSIVIIPDPMGATGATLVETLDLYKTYGRAKKYIALLCIVTPEYLKKVTEKYPELIVYTMRLDRGFSSEKVLNSIPGTYWSEERGLNDQQYIVPGGGGFGEILNNAYV